MYSDKVTIFNRSGSEKKGFTWFPTVLDSVDVTVDKGANQQKTGIEKADSAKLHIRYFKTVESIVVSGKKYITPKLWERQDKSEKAATITFNEGVDFFMIGEYPETPIEEDEGSLSGGVFDTFNRNLDGVYKITTVGGPYKLIPHFELGGA